MMTFGVVLLSGGLDSTVVTAYAKERCDNLTAITFFYGQSHNKEVCCAQDIASLLGIKHKLVDISFLRQIAWYSALTNTTEFPVPKNGGVHIEKGVPITYVPLRNTIFLSLSAAYLESQVLYSIEHEAVLSEDVQICLYMAPNTIDYSGYPDCRPEFFDQVEKVLRYGSKIGSEYGREIHIDTPIIRMSKSEIVDMGTRLKAPLGHTWSCYEAGNYPCGKCDSCILRARGFEEAGLIDPLLVRLGMV